MIPRFFIPPNFCASPNQDGKYFLISASRTKSGTIPVTSPPREATSFTVEDLEYYNRVGHVMQIATPTSLFHVRASR